MDGYVALPRRSGKSAALRAIAQDQADAGAGPVDIVGPRGQRERLLPRFGMADHDEMAGTSAWDDWQRRGEQWIDDFAWLRCAPVEAPAPTPPPPPAAAAAAMLARPARRLTFTGDPRNGPVKLTPEPEDDERDVWRDLAAQVFATGRGSVLMGVDRATGRATFRRDR